MDKTSVARQLLVTAAPQLAAMSVGAAVSYPNVLLQQLSANDTIIHLDLDSGSSIGSFHGFAGILGIVMPTFMQWKGRKFAFIVACLFNLAGWILSFSATDIMTILISESFQGLGNNSIMGVGLLSMSEMVAPKFRNVSLMSYTLLQAMGMALCVTLGYFLHWKTVSWIMCIPISIAILLAFLWPESPPWLAYKGKYDKCEKAFASLRGFGEESSKELIELISAQKEKNCHSNGKANRFPFNLNILLKRDFYLPSFHIFVVIGLSYFSGLMACLIYSMKLVQSMTKNEDTAYLSGVIVNVVVFVAVAVSLVLARQFKNKSMMISTAILSAISLLGSSLSIYLQTTNVLSEDSLIGVIFLVAFLFFECVGVVPVAMSVTAELMPVKYRGIGGGFLVLVTSILHAVSLKVAPYLFVYLGVSVTLLIYAVNAIIFTFFIWKCVPETKGRTLQELENFYTDGCFDTLR